MWQPLAAEGCQLSRGPLGVLCGQEKPESALEHVFSITSRWQTLTPPQTHDPVVSKYSSWGLFLKPSVSPCPLPLLLQGLSALDLDPFPELVSIYQGQRLLAWCG